MNGESYVRDVIIKKKKKELSQTLNEYSGEKTTRLQQQARLDPCQTSWEERKKKGGGLDGEVLFLMALTFAEQCGFCTVTPAKAREGIYLLIFCCCQLKDLTSSRREHREGKRDGKNRGLLVATARQSTPSNQSNK